MTERLEQHLLVFLGDQVFQLALLRDLGQQLGDMPLEVDLDVAHALRLAAERLAGMQEGVVVDLLERLQLTPSRLQ